METIDGNRNPLSTYSANLFNANPHIIPPTVYTPMDTQKKRFIESHMPIPTHFLYALLPPFFISLFLDHPLKPLNVWVEKRHSVELKQFGENKLVNESVEVSH